MKSKIKSETYIVTVDDDDEINIIDELEMRKYTVPSSEDGGADKAQVDPVTGSKNTPSKHFLIGENFVEPKYDPHLLVNLLDLYSYHEACVDAVSTDAAGIDYTFNQVEGLEIVDEEKERINKILKESTPGINTHLRRVAYDCRAIGYGAIEVIRYGDSNSDIRRFKHIPSHTLRRHTDEKRVLHTDDEGNRVWYVIYGKNYDENGQLADVHADTGIFYPHGSLPEDKRANELIWIMEYAPGTNYYGRPPIIAALPSIQGDLSAVQYNVSFFKNMGMPKFAVTVTGDFLDYDVPEFIEDDEGKTIPNPDFDIKQTLRWKIGQQIKQIIKHPHSALCITIPSEGEEGNVNIDIIPLSVQSEEGHFRMYRKDIRDEVIHAHKVDPSRLAIFDAGSLNGTNSDNTKESYKYGTIAPFKAILESIVNRVFKELKIKTITFNIIDVSPVDYTKDMELAKFLFNSAAMTPMDLINVFGAKFGLSVDDHDQEYYLKSYYLNGVPLEKIWNESESNPYLEADTILGSIESQLIEKTDETEVDEDDLDSENS